MYRLIRFATVSLEYYNPIDDIGSGETPSSYFPLPEGGAIDNFGSLQKHPGVVERVKTITIYDDSEVIATNLYLRLLALRGKRDRLYRRTLTGDIHWMYARLKEVKARRDRFAQKLDLRFETQEAHWRGDLGGNWDLDSGEFLDSGLAFDSGESYALNGSPKAITITTSDSAGRAAVRSLRIRVTVGSAPITAITIARTGGESLTFGASIAAGDVLLIDTGTMQVTNDGVDAYDDLTLSPTADLAAWFALEAGDNALTVTYTGGGTGSTIDFSYYEAWY